MAAMVAQTYPLINSIKRFSQKQSFKMITNQNIDLSQNQTLILFRLCSILAAWTKSRPIINSIISSSDIIPNQINPCLSLLIRLGSKIWVLKILLPRRYLYIIIQNSYKMSNYSYLFKLIIIGDTSVGKSCILLHFIQKKFKFDHDTTIGVEFGSKIINVASQSVKLQIWDTAGQETFKSITRSYYRGSIGVILVYDITNRESFSNITKWLDETKAYSNDKITSFLVGNKSDLENKRSVSYDQGFNLAKKNGLLFMECSAKSGQNIEGIFGQISQAIVGKIERGQIDPKNESIGIKLGSMQNSVDKQKRCC